MVLQRADGQGRPADERQGPAHRRLRRGASCRPRRRWRSARSSIAGHGAWRSAREGAGRVARLVHRRGRHLARRVARGHQPVRGAQAAGDLLRRRTTRPRSRRRCASNSAVRVFADKAAGYGIPGITIDGTDPEAIAAAFAWAAERARAGHGPDADRAGRDAHVRPRASRRHALPRQGPAAVVGLPAAHDERLRRPRALRVLGDARSDRRATPRKLEAERRHQPRRARSHASARPRSWSRREAQRVIAAPWPEPDDGRRRRVRGRSRRASAIEVLEPARRLAQRADRRRCRRSRPAPPFDKKGNTFLEAVMLGVGDALRADPRVFVYGEDVGGSYGNAFLLLRPLLEEFGDRILNSPLAEGAVLGVCVGAALAGQRPIGEMQFNDFVATGFNQLVNNAAKIRYRWGGEVPMVVRMPWGGLRHAGPYHSPEHRAVVLPHAGPEDRRAVDARRRARADGGGGRRSRSGALLRAHRALSRSADQAGCWPTRRRRRCRSARPRCAARATTWRSSPTAPTCTTACASPRRWPRDGIEAAVLDLRTLAPLDRDAVLAVARHCSRVLIVHEDSRTGGIGESARGDHPGRGVRVARRAGAHPRRARHAGALLAAARGGVPGERGRDRHGGAEPGGLLERQKADKGRRQKADTANYLVRFIHFIGY